VQRPATNGDHDALLLRREQRTDDEEVDFWQHSLAHEECVYAEVIRYRVEYFQFGKNTGWDGTWQSYQRSVDMLRMIIACGLLVVWPLVNLQAADNLTSDVSSRLPASKSIVQVLSHEDVKYLANLDPGDATTTYSLLVENLSHADCSMDETAWNLLLSATSVQNFDSETSLTYSLSVLTIPLSELIHRIRESADSRERIRYARRILTLAYHMQLDEHSHFDRSSEFDVRNSRVYG
jgi:hypothetical protein